MKECFYVSSEFLSLVSVKGKQYEEYKQDGIFLSILMKTFLLKYEMLSLKKL